MSSPQGQQEMMGYLDRHKVPALFKSIISGMIYHEPEDPLSFIEECIQKIRKENIAEYTFETFVGPRRSRRPRSRVATGRLTKAAERNLVEGRENLTQSSPLPAIGQNQANKDNDKIEHQEDEAGNEMRVGDADDDGDEFAATVEKVKSIKEPHPDNRTTKHFDVDYFNSLPESERRDLIRCCKSGIDNPDSSMGCYAMQPADYDRFKPFFSKVIADYHGVAEDAKHVNDWSLEGIEGLPEDGRLDLEKLGLPALSMRVRVGRNLADFPLPGAMTKDDRVNMEKKMCEAFDKLKAMPEYGGKYNSLTPDHPDHISDDEYKQLVADHIMFKDMAADPYLASAGISADWPYGRGCYVSEDRGFIIWVGEEDHLRIMCMKKGTILNDVFDRLKTALDVVSSIDGIDFAKSPDYGYVTSCPTNLGTGMRASVHIPLPNLTSDGTDKKAKEVCKPLGLSVRGTGGEHTPIGKDGTCDISPRARFCIKESEIITALYNGIKQLKEAEDGAGEASPEVTDAESGAADTSAAGDQGESQGDEVGNNEVDSSGQDGESSHEKQDEAAENEADAAQPEVEASEESVAEAEEHQPDQAAEDAEPVDDQSTDDSTKQEEEGQKDDAGQSHAESTDKGQDDGATTKPDEEAAEEPGDQ